MKRRITLLLGNNIDKGLIDKIREKIAKDKDIKALFRVGKREIYGKFYRTLILLGLSVVSIVGRFSDEELVWTNTPYKDTVLSVILPILFTAGMILNFVFGTADDLNSIRDYCMTIVGYFKYIFSRKLPKTSLEVWKVIQGSVADIQMLNTCRQIDSDDEIDAVYSGAPYYDTIFIDDITVRWNIHGRNAFENFIKTVREEFLYAKYRENFAKRLMMAKADDNYFIKGKNQLAYSNSVFGILFSSGYFEEQQRSKKENKICVSIDPGMSPSERLYSREWMKYVLTPSFAFFDEKAEDCDESAQNLIVTGIRTSKSQTETSRHHTFGEIRIPVKRFIVVPVGNVNGDRLSSPLPAVVEKKINDSMDCDNNMVICIGGAEQNLGLQCIMNYFRWRPDKQGPDIGFAENSFEDSSVTDFLAGTEGLVYSVKNTIMCRLPLKGTEDVRDRADVYRMFWNDHEVYNIYGYSAMATKMTLGRFIFALSGRNKGKETNEESYIPGKAKKTADILDYKVTSDKEHHAIFDSEAGKTWDENDFMNNVEMMCYWMEDEETGQEIHIIDGEKNV